jgi:hypothetical protein
MSSEDGVMALIPPLAASEAKRRSIRRVPDGPLSARRPVRIFKEPARAAERKELPQGA